METRSLRRQNFRLHPPPLTLAAATLLAPGPAAAADYPARPIRLVVPYPPGASSNDILGRGLAQRLSARLGQQVVVDNRAGASGTMGSEMVAKAPADGYTLLIAVASPLAVGPSLSTQLRSHPAKHF